MKHSNVCMCETFETNICWESKRVSNCNNDGDDGDDDDDDDV